MVSAVRELPGGRVLLNDPASRQVVMLDSTLAVIRVVADSSSSTANAYGTKAGALIAYPGDSTLFVDQSSLSMLLLDPDGRIVRVMALPRPRDVMYLFGGWLYGNPSVDTRGRLVYRTRTLPPVVPPSKEPVSLTVAGPDSTPLLRFDLITRTLDTAAYVHVLTERSHVTRTQSSYRSTLVDNPIPVTDEWGVLPDGSIAIVRGRDYSVEVLSLDGTWARHGKVPFDWQRLTDDDKQRIIDSSRSVRAGRKVEGRGGFVLAAPSGPAAGTGVTGNVTTTLSIDGESGARRQTVAATKPEESALMFVPAADLPDYRPAFSTGSMRIDTRGRLWMRTIPTKPLEAGPSTT